MPFKVTGLLASNSAPKEWCARAGLAISHTSAVSQTPSACLAIVHLGDSFALLEVKDQRLSRRPSVANRRTDRLQRKPGAVEIVEDVARAGEIDRRTIALAGVDLAN